MLQIYLIGVVIAAILYCCDIYLTWKDGVSITLSDILGLIFTSALSWLSVLWISIYYFATNANDIIIIKGKRNKN